MNFIKRILCGIAVLMGAFAPNIAMAGIIDVDSLDISGLVPVVLDAFMFVANGTYAYFVGEHHNGIIYLLIWGFVAFYIALYLIKLYLPKFWLKTFGFDAPSATVENTKGVKIGESIIKPGIRVLVAVLVLLPLKPQFLANGLINPFLHFGSLYTTEIIKISSDLSFQTEQNIKCPSGLLEQGWLSNESCNYLIQPVHVLSRANNAVVKRGFKYITSGLQSLVSFVSHNSGQGFMNIITGLLLIGTFTACNIFMALLIIQAIFDFGIALILYPFNVIAWVTKQSDDWFNVWPAFSGIIDALKKIIITMIASAFILCVNLALVSAIFQWNGRVFVAAVGGTAYSNLPTGVNSSGFGEHSVLWLSCLLTYFLMNRIFEITRDKLKEYTGKGSTELYDRVKGDVKTSVDIVKSTGKSFKTAWKVFRGK